MEIILLRNGVCVPLSTVTFARYRSDCSVRCGTDRVTIYRSVFIDLSKWFSCEISKFVFTTLWTWLSCEISKFFCNTLWRLFFWETAFCVPLSIVTFARYRSDCSVRCGTDRVTIYRSVLLTHWNYSPARYRSSSILLCRMILLRDT